MSAFANLRHHLDVVRAAWAEQRDAEKAAKSRRTRRDQELAFLPAALEITETPASPLRRVIAVSVCVFFAITIGWASVGQMDAEWRRDIHATRAETSQRASSIEQELVKAAERNRQQTLIAPVAGTLRQLQTHTVGGVVTPAQVLMQVVPAGVELEVEAMVLNKDIGFVRAGQGAELKVESFPFTKYGTIIGTVRHVYADAVEDERTGLAYPARVAMKRTTMLVGDKNVNLSPGMSITVEIKRANAVLSITSSHHCRNTRTKVCASSNQIFQIVQSVAATRL